MITTRKNNELLVFVIPNPIPILNLIVILIGLICRCNGNSVGAAELENVLQKITQDTVDFALYMEDLYRQQSNPSFCSINACQRSNYADCASELSFATCQAQLKIPSCTTDSNAQCGALFDFTTSSVRVADAKYITNSPIDNSETNSIICYTQQAEQYMRQQYQENQQYWASYGVSPPWYHFGSDEAGTFRIFPGRNRDKCGTFDPRFRPWYVGASSGPKDVVLVLDTSGSMDQFGRLEAMQNAAARVIGTLGLQDYVSVVEFNTLASKLGSSQFLQRATQQNKDELIELVYNLQAAGKTNFYDAFELAFSILNDSVKENEVSAGCHKAILFLTDGKMSSGPEFRTIEDLLQLIENQSSIYDDQLPIIFTYSFGNDADDDVPKQIACRTDGIWTRIEDGGDLAASMAAYYQYFAFGLASDTPFVSWSEPYTFATGGHLGVTASAPVYDRSVSPSILVGVVGLDFTFEALETALGVGVASGNSGVLDRLFIRSVSVCPDLSLSECDIQTLRQVGFDEGIEGLCPGQCGNVTDISSKTLLSSCAAPFNIWHNLNNIDRTYEEKTCCSVQSGERSPGDFSLEEIQKDICVGTWQENTENNGNALGDPNSAGDDDSDDGGGSAGIIAGIVVAIVVLLVVGIVYKRYSNRQSPDNSGSNNNTNGFSSPPPMEDNAESIPNEEAIEQPVNTSIEKTDDAAPPPSLPVAEPEIEVSEPPLTNPYELNINGSRLVALPPPMNPSFQENQ